MIVAFDIDDTLIIPRIVFDTNADIPNYNTIDIYRWFQSQGHTMIIWSGGGISYAEMWANKLGLNPNSIWTKEKHLDDNGNPRVDMCFDDCLVDLAKVNIQVKRIKNNVSRKDWNNHE